MAAIAGIDIGTNTLRLLVSEIDNDYFKEIYSEKRITRLGEGLSNLGCLTKSAIGRSITTLKDFRSIIDRYKIDEIVVVATSAVREAGNRQYFIDLVRRETGFDIEMISGEEEARRTFLGILHGLDKGIDSIVAIDIGGGSTEFIYGRGGKIITKISTGLGVVKLTEKHIKSDPILPSDLAYMQEEIEDKIKKAITGLGEIKGARLVGTAGSITTLAAIDQKLETYNPVRINNYILKLTSLERIFSEFISRSINERKKIVGLEPGREDIIVAGAAILRAAMKEMGYDSLIVSDYGLREGIVIDAYMKRYAKA